MTFTVKTFAHASVTKKPSEKLQTKAKELDERLSKFYEELGKDFPNLTHFGRLHPDMIWNIPGAEQEWDKFTKECEQELTSKMKGWKAQEGLHGSTEITGNIKDGFEFVYSKHYFK